MYVTTGTNCEYITLVESASRKHLFGAKKLMLLFTYGKLQDKSEQFQRLLFINFKLVVRQPNFKADIFSISK